MSEIDSIPGLTRRRGPGWIATFLLSTVVAAGVFIGGRYAEPYLQGVLPPATAPAASEEAEAPTAPDLVGLPPRTAIALAQVSGLEVTVGEERADDEHPAGIVLEQTPAAGEAVDGPLTLVVSSGPAAITVPEVAGKTIAEARTAITEAGLTVGDVSEEGEGDPGTVTASEPAAGTEVEAGAAVALTTVPDVARVGRVPSVLNMHRREASEAITAAGFAVGRIRTRYDADRGPHRVLSQDPAAGTAAEPGTTVNLVANQGP